MEPQELTYPTFFEPYVSKALNLNTTIIQTLETTLKDLLLLLSDLNDEKQLYAYDEDKWTIKELLSHMIDTERILAYRALSIARNEKSNLLSFDENEYVTNSNANEIPFADLLNEFSLVRKSIIALYRSFNDEIYQRIGIVGNSKVSVQALGYIISGHVLHHLGVIESKYL